MPRRQRRTECDAYKVFKKNLTRSRAFIRVFEAQGGPGQPSNDRKELLRGAVVFAVGSLDAFLHDVVLEIVPKHGATSPELADALKAIAREDPSLALRVALKRNQAEAADEFRAALDAWLSTKSFQGPEAVVRACRYIGIDFDWGAMQGGAAAKLRNFSEERNLIVHRGGKPYIKRDKAQDCIDLVASIAQAVNDQLVQRYK